MSLQSSTPFHNQDMNSKCTSPEESSHGQGFQLTESVADTVAFIDGSPSLNQDYKCIRKALLLFIVSFHLKLIQQASGIMHQFFHVYPTLVGWLYLITKLNRLLFSAFSSALVQQSWRMGLHSCPNMNSAEKNHEGKYVEMKPSSLFQCDGVIDRRQDLQMNEYNHQNSISMPRCVDESVTNLHAKLEKTQLPSGVTQKKVHVTNSSDSKCMVTSCSRSKCRTSFILSINRLVSENRKNDEVDESSSWGYFVDCLSSDDSDRMQVQEQNDIPRSRISPVLSNDYGQFVDIQS